MGVSCHCQKHTSLQGPGKSSFCIQVRFAVGCFGMFSTMVAVLTRTKPNTFCQELGIVELEAGPPF